MVRLYSCFRMEDVVGSVMLALILSVSQAFGVIRDMHFLAAFGIWIVVLLPVWLMDAVPIRWVLQTIRQSYLVGLMLAMSVVLIASIPQTLYIQLFFKFVVNETISFEPTFIQVLAVSLSVTILIYVLTGDEGHLGGRVKPTHTPSPDQVAAGSNAKFLTDQLPHVIGDNIVSMHAEDHYLRIVTDKGEALILMRLRDAIAAMGEDVGMQTHRSHWVAGASNPELIRQNGKPALMLDDGRTVPVSRHYVRAVRASLSARRQ